MNIRVTRLPKNKLDRIPELERAFYIHIGHLRNELAILQRLLWWNNNTPVQNTIYANVNLSQGLLILRLLAGKLWEGWELMGRAYFATKVSQSIESKLSRKAKTALKELKDYFSKGSIVHMIRNNFAFHYSAEHIRGQLDKLEDADILEMYTTPFPANTFYPFSEIAAIKAMAGAIGEDSDEESLKRLIIEVLKITETFVTFCDWTLFYMVQKYFAKKGKFIHFTDVTLIDVPRRDEVQLPFFIRDITDKR